MSNVAIFFASVIVAEAEGKPASEPAPVAAVDNSAVPLVIRLESATEQAKVQAPVEIKPAPESTAVDAIKTESVAAPIMQPTVDLAAAGLQLVETVAPIEADVADAVEQAASPRRRRSRGGRGNVQAASEGLVMVETRTEGASVSEPASIAQAGGESPSEWGPPSNPRRRARPKSEDQVVAEPLVMVETKPAASEQNSAV